MLSSTSRWAVVIGLVTLPRVDGKTWATGGMMLQDARAPAARSTIAIRRRRRGGGPDGPERRPCIRSSHFLTHCATAWSVLAQRADSISRPEPRAADACHLRFLRTL